MVTLSVMHNGSTNLPLKRSDGIVIPDAPVRAIHEDCQSVVMDQIRHGITAEKHGFDKMFFTEHHFQPTGAEFSTNPMMSQMYIAAKTETIRLAQAANIITWHDPVRFAEQVALLDIVSDGRAEIGVGRGYQPRENEVLGQYWGGTIQDQEKNRASWKEKLAIMKAAWTEDVFSYDGEFHEVPPSWTKWHHDQDRAYFADSVTEYEVEDVIDWKEGDIYSSSLWNPILAGGSTLRSMSVFPQPLQDPYPQLWQPVTSRRSIRGAAQEGINGYFNAEPNELLKDRVAWYMEDAEAAEWPDHRPEHDGDPFRYGWDDERNRGLAVSRFVFNTDVHDTETFERWKLGQEHAWDFYGPFGFSAIFSEDRDPDTKVTADMLIEEEVAIVGGTDELIEKIARIKETCGFEDFHFAPSFEIGGITGEEADEQLIAFANDVMPYLREEFPSHETPPASDD